MDEKKRDIYGDNFLDEYPSYGSIKKPKDKISSGAVFYGAGLALAITFLALLAGVLWSQAVTAVSVNFSFLVDISLAGSALIGSFKGSMRAKSLGLAHGALIGLVYSVAGILLLAVALPINWTGALETIAIATFLGSIGGIAGFNVRVGRESRNWRTSFDSKPTEEYNLFDDFAPRR